ncbi:hypothetical protein [Nostoc sp. ChiQUE01b]|uniref:hypothetical protein n=1 Tax=Nostoc sp. ChiQUE01b TaxID=3075376 RepID=UPI002AD2C118|nr:hypothetical protein [Nostoc sp. ChiQUE01b]
MSRCSVRSHPKNPYIIKYATLLYVLIRYNNTENRLAQANKDTLRAIAIITAQICFV